MKIDVTRIVVAHIKTLRDVRAPGYSSLDLFVFYGAPITLAAACSYFSWHFDSDVLNALLTAFSIFAGLLLNLLLLVYTLSAQTNNPSVLAKVRADLVKELHDNIAYSILLSIVLVVILMCTIAYLKMVEPARHTGPWLTGIISFLTFNFLLTLLMILKRIYIIVNKEIDKSTINKKTA